MGILHQYDGQRGVLHIVWDGIVTWRDWSKQIENVTGDPLWRSSQRFLADLRSVTDTSTIGPAEVDEAVKLFSADRDSLTHKRGAIIALQEFGRARRFADLLTRFGSSVVIFNNIDTACLFLGLDVAETNRLLEGLRRQLRDE